MAAMPMLVKILSFIASALSSTRYKGLLVPCSVLVLTLTGLTVAVFIHDDPPQSAASAVSSVDESLSEKSASPDLSGMSSEKTKEAGHLSTTAPPEPENGPNPPAQASVSPQVEPAKPPEAPVDIILSTSTVSLSPNSSSNSLVAATSDNSEAGWTVNPTGITDSGITVIAERPRDREKSSMNFRLYATQHAVPGQHQFVITAKNTIWNTSLTKILTVNIEQ